MKSIFGIVIFFFPLLNYFFMEEFPNTVTKLIKLVDRLRLLGFLLESSEELEAILVLTESSFAFYLIVWG